MAKKSGKTAKCTVESVLDLCVGNVWSVDGFQLAELWNKDVSKEGFATKEEKLLNIIRTAFDVAHYDPEDERAKARYENGEWATFTSHGGRNGEIAIRKKQIKQLSDLNRENVKRLTAATVLELIDRNFGGGWDSVPPATKEIIERRFDISVTQLPTSRIHAKGGTLERKVKNGFDVLEVTKGTWTEAIFARKKELVDFPDEEEERKERRRTRVIIPAPTVSEDTTEEAEAEEADRAESQEAPAPEEEFTDEETYYSSYIEEASPSGETEEEEIGDGFVIEEGE